MFIPRNELGVLYLFSRLHEKMGFEEVVDVSPLTPDIIAKRNGKQVFIELEFKSGGAFSHYRVADEDPREGKWIKEENVWKFVLNTGGIGKEVPDSQNEYRLDKDRGVLLRRTAKEIFDIIVCWEKDEVFEENMEVIELKKALTKVYRVIRLKATTR